MEKITKWLIIAVLALYVASPVDLAPGPVDDAVAVLIYMIAARRKRAIEVFDDGYVQETVNTDQPGTPF